MTQAFYEDAERFSALRTRAEQRLSNEAARTVDVSLEEAKRLLQELSVYQIELELQNEELRAAQIELEASRRKYIELYEFSPVGLVVIDHEERIQDPNLMFVTMLGVARYKLIKWTLSTFISADSQDTYHFFYQALRRTQQPQQCEIALLSISQTLLHVRLDGTALVQGDTQTTYRIAVTDLTAQKQVETQKLELATERQRIQELLDLLDQP